MALRDYIPGPLNLILAQLRNLCDAIEALIGSGGGGSGIDVASFATGGDGTSANPWTGWDTAITWAEHTQYFFRKGVFAYATSPNFLKYGIALIGEAGTILQHTGSGNAFVMDAGATVGSLWIQNVRVENLTIRGHWFPLTGFATATGGTDQVVGTSTLFTTELSIGDSISFGDAMSTESRVIEAIADDTHLTVSANWSGGKSGNIVGCKSTNGIFLRGVRNGIFRHLNVKDVVGAALLGQGLVTNTIENFRCTYHEPEQFDGFNARPQFGIVLAGRGADTTTLTMIITPVIEGVQDTGIWFKRESVIGSYCNALIGGTSEGHPDAKGIQIDSDHNVIQQTDIEFNGTGDSIIVNGERNTFINVFAYDNPVKINTGAGNRFIGGQYEDIIIDLTAGHTIIDGPLILGSVTDNSLSTIYFPRVTLADGFRHDARLGNVIQKIDYLTSGASVSTNARNANLFDLVPFENFTMANPTNGIDGQAVTWRITQTASYTITFGSKFRAPASKNLPAMPTIAGELLIFTAVYNSTDDKWDLVWANSEVFSVIEAAGVNVTGWYEVDGVQVIADQQPAIANPTGGTTVDTEGRAATVSILTVLRNHGLIAASAPFDLSETFAYFNASFLRFKNNELVHKWRDLGLNVHPLLQPMVSKRPTFITNQINGQPIVRFNGTTNEMRTSAFAYPQPVAISVVCKRINASFAYLLSSLSDFGCAMVQGVGFPSDPLALFSGGVAPEPFSDETFGAAHLITGIYDGSSSNVYDDTVLSADSPGNPGAQSGSGLVLGNRFDSAWPWAGDVGAVVLYDPSIRTSVETFLMDFYSL